MLPLKEPCSTSFCTDFDKMSESNHAKYKQRITRKMLDTKSLKKHEGHGSYDL